MDRKKPKVLFPEFVKYIFEVKDDVREVPLSLYKKLLYSNFRYWCVLAVSAYIKDRRLENDDLRNDELAWDALFTDMCLSIKDFCIGSIRTNAVRNNLIDLISMETQVDKQLVRDAVDDMIEFVINEVFDEYCFPDFDIIWTTNDEFYKHIIP